MRHTFPPFVLAAATLAIIGTATAAEPLGNALTIYSSAPAGAISPDQYRQGYGGNVPGYAVVRHERAMDLPAGRSEVRFTDVAGLIDPTTV